MLPSSRAHALADRLHRMSEPHVLTVDADPAARELIAAYLRQHQVRVTTLADADAMHAVLADEVVDLVMLDLQPSRDDAIERARLLRNTSAIPIIMLSSRREVADLVMALEMGADDYMTKPFSPRELLARIRAVLRRQPGGPLQGKPPGVRAFRFDGWELNLSTRRLLGRDGPAAALTNVQFGLLLALLGSPRRILSRRELLDLSRLHNDEVYERSVDVQIMRLRRRIEQDPSQPRCIVTERGAGYVLNAQVQTIY